MEKVLGCKKTSCQLSMDLNARIDVLSELGNRLAEDSNSRKTAVAKSQYENLWFTEVNVHAAISAIIEEFLNREKLEQWIDRYDLTSKGEPKRVAIIMAGNIPLVGFHDFLTCFLSGHKSIIKLSDKDKVLFAYIKSLLTDISREVKSRIEIVERLEKFDAVIATGSNNSSKYFHQYFGKYPHIIRHNRNGIAILDGREDQDELKGLAEDIMNYFGLGCRNVSKIYVPREYNFEPLVDALKPFRDAIMHRKYKNNFDYNLAIFMLNLVPHINVDTILIREDKQIASRIACLNYEVYDDLASLKETLIENKHKIQCTVSGQKIPGIETIEFGKTQRPALWDYADGVDTMEFLLSI